MSMKLVSVFFLVVVLATLQSQVDGKIWALLVAGSNGWYNYRHQADVCHSYQILHKHGVADENIIVMMYDDIAKNYRNPTPGKVINKPGGSDVYHGVLKDYTGEDVTPSNFLNILKGDKSAMAGIGSGKVIESGPDDDVFVYFADHGAPGLIAFPSSELEATALNKAIVYLTENKKFNKMVFYIEACESGSMFDQTLASNTKIFATTAANARESSYACYYDKARETYLGDVYSVKWMEDSDKEDLTIETLQKQFDIVKKEVNTSHVKEFGDMSLKNDKLSLYQGGKKAANATIPGTKSKPITDAVPSPDVPLMILNRRLEAAKTKVEYKTITAEIQKEEKTRSLIRVVVKTIVGKLVVEEAKKLELLSLPAKLKNTNCYSNAVATFKAKCFKFNEFEYALRQLFVLSNLCDEGIATETITSTIDHVCNIMLN